MPGGRATCLVRSLVAGALLADRADVVLHVGFRPAQPMSSDLHEGHAWLSCAGTLVIPMDSPERSDGRYKETMTMILSRG